MGQIYWITVTFRDNSNNSFPISQSSSSSSSSSSSHFILQHNIKQIKIITTIITIIVGIVLKNRCLIFIYITLDILEDTLKQTKSINSRA